MFPCDKNCDICPPTPCIMLSLNVQITQPYCPCCQFCHPFQIPSYLPTYLPATSLPACFYHLLCHLYACSSNGVNAFTTGQSPSFYHNPLNCLVYHMVTFLCGLSVGGNFAESQTSGRDFKTLRESCLLFTTNWI